MLLAGILTAAAVVAFLSRAGRYYLLPLWLRPDNPLHAVLQPSGRIGLGLGMAGASMVAIGVALYSLRKRLKPLQRKGPMRTWLNVHIYLCLVGPVLVTFHTALKFGGLGVYAWWSMMIVAGSGIVGRWLYQQFPRSIKGRELSLKEVQSEQEEAHRLLALAHGRAPAALKMAEAFAQRRVIALKSVSGVFTLPRLLFDDLARPLRLAGLRRRLRRFGGLPEREVHAVVELVRDQIVTARRLAFLGLFKRLFLYWHMTHFVFFFAMVVLLVLHVAAAMFFGASLGQG